MKIIDKIVIITAILVSSLLSFLGGRVWEQFSYDATPKVIYRTTEKECEPKIISARCPDEKMEELIIKVKLYEEAERLKKEIKQKQQELMYKKLGL